MSMSPTLKQIYDMATYLLSFSEDVSRNTTIASEKDVIDHFRAVITSELKLFHVDPDFADIPGYPRKRVRSVSKSVGPDSGLDEGDQKKIDDYGAF